MWADIFEEESLTIFSSYLDRHVLTVKMVENPRNGN